MLDRNELMYPLDSLVIHKRLEVYSSSPAFLLFKCRFGGEKVARRRFPDL